MNRAIEPKQGNKCNQHSKSNPKKQCKQGSPGTQCKQSKQCRHCQHLQCCCCCNAAAAVLRCCCCSAAVLQQWCCNVAAVAAMLLLLLRCCCCCLHVEFSKNPSYEFLPPGAAREPLGRGALGSSLEELNLCVYRENARELVYPKGPGTPGPQNHISYQTLII